MLAAPRNVFTAVTLGENFLGLNILNPGEKINLEGLDIKFLDNNHILGSIQVEVKDFAAEVAEQLQQ